MDVFVNIIEALLSSLELVNTKEKGSNLKVAGHDIWSMKSVLKALVCRGMHIWTD